MQPQEWVRAEPWHAGPELMSAMGLGEQGAIGVASGEAPVSRGEAEPSSSSGEELVSYSEAEPGDAGGEELVSREDHLEDPAAAERAGSEAMWRSVIGERSEAVGGMACVQAPKGVRLRSRPNLGGADLGILPFGETVHVQRRTKHRWCWVVVVSSGAAGFVEQHFLAMNPPDPGARLLLVKPGDKLHEVVSRHYQVREGSDARLYVQAIVAANRGRRGVYLEEGELDDFEEAVRTESAERTVATYRGARVRKGHAIWLPKESFVAALRSLGAIGSGESVPVAAWRGAKAMAGAALDSARYAAAFTIGLLEGGFGAVVDLFSGAAELVQTVAQVALKVLTGDGAALVAMARGWVSKLQKVWENRGAIAEDFLRKWEAEDAWTRGTFQGEVLGWVMMTALLCIATAGAGALSAAGQISGRWAAVLRALAAIDALGDITTYVGAAARLPAKAASHLRSRLGMVGKEVPSTSAPKATKGADPWEELDEPLDVGVRTSAGESALPIDTPTIKVSTQAASEIRQAFRRAKKVRAVGAVSLKRLRLVLGNAGAQPGKYVLAQATKAELDALGDAAKDVFGWVARDGAGQVVTRAGRPVITFTPRGLSSLEEAVKTFGHETKHLKDFAAGLTVSSEAMAEEAGEKLWLVVQRSFGR